MIDCEWELRLDDNDNDNENDCGCMSRVDCWKCGGEGVFDLYEEDPLAFDPGETQVCDECRGVGGYLIHGCGIENRGELAPVDEGNRGA